MTMNASSRASTERRRERMVPQGESTQVSKATPRSRQAHQRRNSLWCTSLVVAGSAQVASMTHACTAWSHFPSLALPTGMSPSGCGFTVCSWTRSVTHPLRADWCWLIWLVGHSLSDVTLVPIEDEALSEDGSPKKSGALSEPWVWSGVSRVAISTISRSSAQYEETGNKRGLNWCSSGLCTQVKQNH